MNLLDSLAQIVLAKLDDVAKSLPDGVRIDGENRRVFVPDTVVKKALQLAASRLKDGELVDFGPALVGYACVIRFGGSTARIVAAISEVTWHGETVSVRLETPQPIEIANRPILTFLANAVSSVFGGTSIGEWILSGPLPDSAVWNGRRAVLTFDISSQVMLQGWLSEHGGPVSIDVSHDANGLWLKFADETRPFVLLLQFVAELVARVMAGRA